MPPFLYALTLPNINRFSKLFYSQTIIILSLKIPPHLKCVATLPCEISSVFKTIENETTSVSTYFKKLITVNNVFIVSVIVYSNCHILQFLHQMFNVSALVLDDALKLATNGAINETQRHTLDISQGSVAIHLRCGGIFSDSINFTNFLLILTVK